MTGLLRDRFFNMSVKPVTNRFKLELTPNFNWKLEIHCFVTPTARTQLTRRWGKRFYELESVKNVFSLVW